MLNENMFKNDFFGYDFQNSKRCHDVIYTCFTYLNLRLFLLAQTRKNLEEKKSFK